MKRFLAPSICLGLTALAWIAVQAGKPAVSAVQPPALPPALLEAKSEKIDDALQAKLDSQTTATAGLRDLRISPTPGGLSVRCQGIIKDKRAGSHYVWYVRLFDQEGYNGRREDNQPAWEWVYADRIVESRPEVRMQPEFSDVITPGLPPGDYVLEIMLSNLPPGMDPSMVRGGDHWANLKLTSMTERVALAP